MKYWQLFRVKFNSTNFNNCVLYVKYLPPETSYFYWNE